MESFNKASFGSAQDRQDNSFKNSQELEELAKKLEEKARKRKKRPMRMHGASLRDIQRIQKKRVLRQAQDKERESDQT